MRSRDAHGGGGGFEPESSAGAAAGKRTLTGNIQRKPTPSADAPASSTTAAFAEATDGPASPLPFRGQLEAAFGFDLGSVSAHLGGAHANAGLESMGAQAATHGATIAFRDSSPSLGLVAHETAHVVQQARGSGGVQPKAVELSAATDEAERRADAAADAIVAGLPVPDVGSAPASTVHRSPDGKPSQPAADGKPSQPAGTATDAPAITPPVGGIDKPGFIDHGDGANLRTGPAEVGGKTVIDHPLPPATRVFVSGAYPGAAQWWYVTAFLPDRIVRGYVQDFRVTTDLPEPLAKLYQVKSGDTAEKLAVQEFKASVRDGHDLRYYENVLLHVNKERGRAGITGSYQDPGLLGGGANNVQLVAGHRIWLVSPAYAHELEGVVPDGSLTNGVYAKVKRFVQHVVDIIKSVTESRHHLDEIAGEYAQVIHDHIVEIVGIVAGFIAAEAASAFLASTPTGVGQLAAVIIQLALAAFGAAGAVQAGVQALEHGSHWLELAWTAKGSDEKIVAASKEFLRMLVAIAMAALAVAGVKGNYGKALEIASSMPPMGLVPAMAVAGGPSVPMAGAGAGVRLGIPGPAGPVGTAMAMAGKNEHGGGEPSKDELARELESVKQQLESPELSGKQKKALRARKKELQEQLGQAPTEPAAEDIPTPSRFKERKAGLTDAEAATDKPSWIDQWPDGRPGVDESGTVFATRMMNKKYGVGGWTREGAQGTEFSQLKKFGDRAFE